MTQRGRAVADRRRMLGRILCTVGWHRWTVFKHKYADIYYRMCRRCRRCDEKIYGRMF